MTTLELDVAAVSVPGEERPVLQDAVRAGQRLLAVADGFGPQGARVAAGAVGAVGALAEAAAPGDDPAAVLAAGVERAREAAAGDAPGSGTTLTALLLAGERLAVAHVGDTRAYLLRDGELTPLTTDHSTVRALVDAGRLTPAEAAVHPERAVLLRALGHGEPLADLGSRQARAGDRYLLCSDGLWAVVPDAAIARVLGAAARPDDAARDLLAAARESGAPDDLSCVVADAVERG